MLANERGTRRGPLATLALAAGMLAAAYGPGEARAHFLFVRIGPLAEGGRPAEVFFSEQAEAGDPKFVDKIAGATLFVQKAERPGRFEPLPFAKASDRLRASLPGSGALGVVGVCEYGVLARPKQPAFLLRYYPKAVSGRPDEVNALKPAHGALPEGAKPVGLEIVPTFEANRVVLTALRDGKPVPGLEFTTIDSDLSNIKIKAGDDGRAAWTPPKPGRYSVYTSETIKTRGNREGTPYDEIREFATLAFTWPLDRRDGDEAAVSLFEQAVGTRAVWNDFPGFTADLAGSLDGRAFSGSVAVASDGTVKVEVDDDVAQKWLDDQLGSLVMHRQPEGGKDSSKEPARPVLRFADGDEDHPLGRLLAFQGGRFASSYRVKDGQITVVNRNIGPQNMTITVLDNVKNPEGKFLPRSYLIHYWDAATGALNRVETITERWSRVGGVDLPTEHTVATSSNSGLSVRSLTLSGHKLNAARP